MQRAFKQYITLPLLVALAAFAFAACSQTGGGSNSPNATDPNAVAATVNGKPIMMKEVEQVLTQQTQGQQAQLSQLQLAQARLQILDTLIQREVLFQRADKEKLLPSEDEITATINSQKQQSNLTEEDFQKKLKEQNLTAETLRDEARKDLAISKLQDKYNSKIQISDKEVEDTYNGNKQQFVNSRGVALANIVVDPADNSAQGITTSDAKNETEAKLKIDQVYQQLKGHADFADVARARSEDLKSLLQGGDIGVFTEDQLKQAGMPQDLITQLFGAMQVGDYTEPKQINGRWYIFKLKERHLQNENLTLDAVRQQITQALTDQKKQILNAALLADAMNEAKIANNLSKKMLESPNNLSGLRPAPATGAASPAAATSPSPTATTAPQAATTPQASVSPKATPKPNASPKKP
ncbi:MAG: SurA N-terminal domain-containing protein [Pyrinomonadaceae bacterium]